MKNILTLSSLAIAGGVVAASVAELAGGSAPAIVNAPVATSAFVLVLSALLLLGDYGRPARRLVVEQAAPVAAKPARRNGYSIRRGAEAARLANPPANIAVFPKTRVRSCDRAA